jgi:hypothetical protein
MPTLTDEQLLSSGAFNEMVRDQADAIAIAKPLVYADYIPVVDAADEEVMAKWTGAAFAADIIADDGEAQVEDGGTVSASSQAIPNFKHGRRFNQAQIERWKRIARRIATGRDRDQYRNWQRRTADELLLGIRQRRNYVAAGVMNDGLVYDRFGVKLTGNWAMPAGLKINSVVTWDTHATATPVTDVHQAQNYRAQQGDGGTFDVGIMSLAAYSHLIQCTQFINMIQGQLGFAVTAGSFAPEDPRMYEFARNILRLKRIILDDSTYTVRNAAGTKVTARYSPIPNVLLTTEAAKGNSSEWDFANATVTESGEIDGIAEQAGPFGFITRPPELNPPQRTYWAVQRGWYRKHNDYACARIVTGAYSS